VQSEKIRHMTPHVNKFAARESLEIREEHVLVSEVRSEVRRDDL
jgi:hypothetical protein